MKKLFLDYIKLGMIFGPVTFIYGVWDMRYHPTPKTVLLSEAMGPPTFVDHARMFVLTFIFWPVFLVAIVVGNVFSLISYLVSGVWPP